MYLIDFERVPTDFAAYREAIVQAFNISDLQQLCTDHINRDILHDIDFSGSRQEVVYRMLQRADEKGWLRRLLVLALRHRASKREFVKQLAPRLGLVPLVELADELSGTCSPQVLAAAIQTLEPQFRDQSPTEDHHDVCGLWIDRLVWLDEFPAVMHRDPPLIKVLDHVLSNLNPRDPQAHLLREWLGKTRRKFGLVASQPAEKSTGYAILLEVGVVGPTGSVAVWRVNFDGKAEHLFAVAFDALGHEREIEVELARVVDECFARNAIDNPQHAPMPPRFEFMLPRRWLGLPVDQLKVGGSEDNPPTRLAGSFPVIVRPGMWCRPDRIARPIVEGRLARRRERVRANQHRVEVVAEPEAWGPNSAEDAQNDDTLAGLVLAFDDLADDGSVVAQSFQTHVLAVLWPRSACTTACDDTSRQYLRSLIEGVRDAPARVFDARRVGDGIGKQFKDHISLIWHADPVNFPDSSLAVPPLQSIG